MSIENPFALLITWTCYGTWLPGDPRGHVSNLLRADDRYEPKRNTPQTQPAPGDLRSRKRAASLQRFQTATLSSDEARTTAESLVATASERDRNILRGAVLYNHVHLVICKCPADGPEVRRAFKGRSQADLSRDAGTSRRWWTRGGSDRYLHDENSILAAVQYVARQPNPLAEIVENRIVEIRRS